MNVISPPSAIAYMVLHKPIAARQLLRTYGKLVPRTSSQLVTAIKQLVRQQGRPVITKLLEEHPDAKAILQLQNEQTSKCSSCHSDTYVTSQPCKDCGHISYENAGKQDAYVAQLNRFSATELEDYYQKRLRLSNQQPHNTRLAEEVELLWHQVRQRKANETPKTTITPSLPQPATASVSILTNPSIGILLFAAGLLIGMEYSKTMIR